MNDKYEYESINLLLRMICQAQRNQMSEALAACRRERSRDVASYKASAHVIEGTRRERERSAITGRTASVMMRGVGLEACCRSRVRPRRGYGSA